VLLGELVGVRVGVLVGVLLGELVGVRVGVLVGVLLGELVGVLVGVAEGLLVGVLLGVEVGVVVDVGVCTSMLPTWIGSQLHFAGDPAPVPAAVVQLGLLPPLDFWLSQLMQALTSALPSMSES
jgi:hypothetical protein